MKNPAHAGLDIETRLVNAGRAGTRAHGFVNPPVVRGSTVLHEDCAGRLSSGRKILDQALIYGIEGTPTHFALEDVVAEIEGGTRCQIVSTGLAAVTVALLAYVEAGAHLLMPDSAYNPTRQFCDGMLKRMGVTTTYYTPTLTAAELDALMRPETALLFTESPGSHTFEIQDVPALAAVAHARGVPVMLDNTWGVQFFQPFTHGVDVSIQALTKYVGGHSDVLLGAITVNDLAHWERVRMAAMVLGAYASPDDVWLALRGARTLSVRLQHQMDSGIAVAQWFRAQQEVLEVRHPALPGAPGHALWQRDFTGAPSLFGVVFQPEITEAQMVAMIDALRLFGIGASWGGYESLALPSVNLRRAHGTGFGGPAARFHIGLEKVADLTADLDQAFAQAFR
jgi:cystathionine beta-lyase